MPLERLTMLVVPKDGEATLVVPRMEAPRVVEQPEVFKLLPWNETDDPIAIVAGLVGRPAIAAIGDTMWARFLVDLLPHWPTSSTRVRPLDRGDERVAHAQGRRRDRRARRGRRRRRPDRRATCRRGHIPLAGRTEARGQRRPRQPHPRRGPSNASTSRSSPPAENAASAPPPRQRPRDPRRRDRAVRLRRHDGWLLQRHHPLRLPRRSAGRGRRGLRRCCVEAQAARRCWPAPSARRARRSTASPGGSSRPPGTATTSCIAPGTASAWRSTRTRTWSRATSLPLEPGHAFSVEPGIYLPGRWGMRLEDIVVATDAGPRAVNDADHALGQRAAVRIIRSRR